MYIINQHIESVALIITFNPDDRLLKLIDAILPQVAAVVIVDNASQRKLSESLSSIINEKIKIIELDSNKGIATALNEGMNFISTKNYKWVFQFDQDSIPRHDFVKQMFDELNEIENPSPVLMGCSRSNYNSTIVGFIESLTVITSGAMLNVEAYLAVGKYRDDFFIDGVDFEYALRLNKMGYKTGNTLRSLIDHRLGSNETTESSTSWMNTTNHSPLRRYYRARNTILLTRLYFFDYPSWIIKYHFFHSVSILLILLVEKDKFAKLKSIFSGLIDGIKYKLVS